jgi:hypothetical protein
LKTSLGMIGTLPLSRCPVHKLLSVQHVVELLASESDNAPALLGVTSARELDRSLLH